MELYFGSLDEDCGVGNMMASRNLDNRKRPIPQIEGKTVLGPFTFIIVIIVKHVPYIVSDANLQKITVNFARQVTLNRTKFGGNCKMRIF